MRMHVDGRMSARMHARCMCSVGMYVVVTGPPCGHLARVSLYLFLRCQYSPPGVHCTEALHMQADAMGHRMQASHVCRSVGTHAQPARQAPQLDVEEIACTPGSSSVKTARHARAWRPVDQHCCRTSAQVAPCQWQLVGWQGNPTRASAAAVGRARHQWRPPHLCRGWH